MPKWAALGLLVASATAALMSSEHMVRYLVAPPADTSRVSNLSSQQRGHDLVASSADTSITSRPMGDAYDDVLFRNWTAAEHARREAAMDRSREIIPEWMAEHLAWHGEQRAKNSTDTKYLVVRCHYGDVCGGLSDRTSALPFYVMVANLTRRVLLVHWTKPAALENFWVPPPGGLDWRLEGTDVTPDDVRSAAFHDGHGNGLSLVVRQLMGAASGLEDHVQAKVLSVLLDGGQIIHNARTLFNRWRAEVGQRPATEDAYLGWNPNAGVNDHNLFEDVFRLLFTPSPQLERAIYDKLTQLDLVGREYTAAQVRAKHPGVIPDDVALEWAERYAPGKTAFEAKRKIDMQDQLEKGGNSSIPHTYELTDGLRSFYTKLFSNALACADRLAPGLPIYLASDTPFGKHMQNASNFSVRVASDESNRPTHIDSDDNKGREPSDFNLLFVDAHMLARARCLSSNSGFAAFAIRTSGNTCTSIHTKMNCTG